MGGKVAMMLALGNHDWIRKSVIVDMSPTSNIISTSNTANQSLFGKYIHAMRQVSLHARDTKEADLILQKTIPEVSIRQFILTNYRKKTDGYEWRINLDALDQSLSHLWTFPVDPALKGTLTKQVLFIAGGRSNYITKEMLPEIKEWFPNSQVTTVKDAGHWVHAEKPAEFLSIIKSFLNYFLVFCSFCTLPYLLSKVRHEVFVTRMSKRTSTFPSQREKRTSFPLKEKEA